MPLNSAIRTASATVAERMVASSFSWLLGIDDIAVARVVLPVSSFTSVHSLKLVQASLALRERAGHYLSQSRQPGDNWYFSCVPQPSLGCRKYASTEYRR